MTVASGDPTLTFEYEIQPHRPILELYLSFNNLPDCLDHLICRLKEFIKEQLVSIPTAPRPPAPAPAAPSNDPGAMLAGLL